MADPQQFKRLGEEIRDLENRLEEIEHFITGLYGEQSKSLHQLIAALKREGKTDELRFYEQALERYKSKQEEYESYWMLDHFNSLRAQQSEEAAAFKEHFGECLAISPSRSLPDPSSDRADRSLDSRLLRGLVGEMDLNPEHLQFLSSFV
jgi:hypothetical protein